MAELRDIPFPGEGESKLREIPFPGELRTIPFPEEEPSKLTQRNVEGAIRDVAEPVTRAARGVERTVKGLLEPEARPAPRTTENFGYVPIPGVQQAGPPISNFDQVKRAAKNVWTGVQEDVAEAAAGMDPETLPKVDKEVRSLGNRILDVDTTLLDDAGDLAEIAGNAAVDSAGRVLNTLPDVVRNIPVGAVKPAAAVAAEDAQVAMEELSKKFDDTFLGQIAAGSAQSYGAMGAAIVLGSMNRIMGAGYIGADEFTRSWQREEHGLEPINNIAYSTWNAGWEVGTEFGPLSKLIDAKGVKNKMFQFMVREVPGEQIATVTQKMADIWAGMDDNATVDDFLYAAAVTLGTTLVSGGAQVATVATAQRIAEGARRILPVAKQTQITPDEAGLDEVEQAYKQEVVNLLDQSATPEEWARNVSAMQDELRTQGVSEDIIRSLGTQNTFVPEWPASKVLAEATLANAAELSPEFIRFTRAKWNHSNGQIHLQPGTVVASDSAISSSVVEQAKKMAETYLPKNHDPIIITTENRPDHNGAIARVGGAYVIRVNPNNKADDPLGLRASSMESMTDTAAQNTVGHEMSHLIMDAFVREYGPNNAAIMQLFDDYKNFVHNFSKADSLKTGMTTRGMPGDLRMQTANIPAKDRNKVATTAKPQSYSDTAYTYSFFEWLANEGSKQFAKRFSSLNPQEKIARKYALTMQRFWRRYGSTDKSASVGDFLDALAQRRAEDRAAGREAVLTPTADYAETAAKMGVQTINLTQLVNSETADLPPAVKNSAKQVIGHFNKFYKNMYTLTQIAEQNKGVVPLQNYLKFTQEMWAEKTHWQELAVRITNEQIHQLPSGAQEALWMQMLDATIVSDILQRELTSEEMHGTFLAGTKNILAQAGSRYLSAADMMTSRRKRFIENPDMGVAMDAMNMAFKEAIGFPDGVHIKEATGLYAVELESLKQRVGPGEPGRYKELLAELNKQYMTLANRTYFPLKRFGDYAVVVKADRPMMYEGEAKSTGDVLEFSLYKTAREAEKAEREARVKFKDGGHVTAPYKIDQTVQSLAGLPTRMIDILEKQLNLDPKQMQQIRELSFKLAPSASMRKSLLSRNRTVGFSTDGQRAFNSYFLHFGNSMARIKWGTQMQQSIDDLRKLQNQQAAAGTPKSYKLGEIADYLSAHYEYVSEPANEWANLRALGFWWHLGFVPKSAFINLTQIPLVAYPELATNPNLGGFGRKQTGVGNVRWVPGTGDAKATAALTKAMRDVKMIYQSRNTDPKNSRIKQGERLMFEELIRRGIIDESIATESAGLAETDTVDKMTGQKGALHFMNRHGAKMFQTAEKYNRYVTALAAYRMAVANKISHPNAVDVANEVLDKSMFELARWNRPNFMRGKVSSVFLFYQFLQNMLYFIGNNKGNMRYLLMILAVAGLQGLPGAEDLMEMIDAARRWSGIKEADLKGDIRDFIKGLTGASEHTLITPDMAMHGLARNFSFGTTPMWDYFGVPAPEWDVSGSLSMGRIIPGLSGLLNGDLGEAQKDLAGAFWGTVIAAFEAANAPGDLTSDPATWWQKFRDFEQVFPKFMKNAAQAVRIYNDQGETTKSGYHTIPFSTDITFQENQTQTTELMGLALGFPISTMARQKEADWAQMEAGRYWTERYKVRLRNAAKAYRSGDKMAAEQAAASIREWNKIAPPALRIKRDSIKASIRGQSRTQQQISAGRPSQRNLTGVYRDKAEQYDVETETLRR